MNTLPFKRLLGYAGRFIPSSTPRRIILLYHAVGEGVDACPEHSFTAQMDWLSKNASVLPLQELLQGIDRSPLQVALTFDDGYASVAWVAAPIMRNHGHVATVYLTTNAISEEHRQTSSPTKGHLSGEAFMLWTEVRALDAEGWEIGAHGMDHLDLSALQEAPLRYQVAESRAAVERHLDRPCKTFAYPWGRNVPATQRAVEAAGYSNAAGTVHGAVPVGFGAYEFPRIDIRKEYTLSDFEAIIHGAWDYLSIPQKLRAGRQTRRSRTLDLSQNGSSRS